MEKDQIAKLKEIQAYLNYLMGDLMLKSHYDYAKDIMGAVFCINNVTNCYTPVQ